MLRDQERGEQKDARGAEREVGQRPFEHETGDNEFQQVEGQQNDQHRADQTRHRARRAAKVAIGQHDPPHDWQSSALRHGCPPRFNAGAV